MLHTPQVIVIGGPNGAGKTTAAEGMLKELLGVGEFVNADTIAKGLAAFDVESAAMAAGRVMLTRLKELAFAKANFAFETTMSSRTFAPFLKELKEQSGYEVNLTFVYLNAPEKSVERVRARVANGGHDIPKETIFRRYPRGIHNFIMLYLPLADRVSVFDNSADYEPDLPGRPPPLVARKELGNDLMVTAPTVWKRMLEVANG
jgi:predicted ABC-type ATPase